MPAEAPAAASGADNLKGALFMTVSTVGFVSNDTMMKLLSERLSLPQALLLRGVVASGLLLGLVALQGAHRYRPDRAAAQLLGWRIAFEVAGTLAFLNALFHMPIASLTAIVMVTPLAVTLAAALLLGETVSWRRYVAIGVGFVGVLLIVRPGSGHFNLYGLSALGGVACAVGRDLVTRRFHVAVPSSVVASTTALAVMLTGGILSPLAAWHPVDAGALLLLTGAAVTLVVGYLFIVMTMRVGDVGFVSPFRYTVMLWALILGAIVFGEVPDALTLAGSAIVVGAGLYTLFQGRAREARR